MRNCMLRTVAAGLFVAVCLPAIVTAEDNVLTAEEKAAGWELLFDGKTMDQFVNYKSDKLSPAW